jgi:predicted Rossmann-fold nucleotide-binding protein
MIVVIAGSRGIKDAALVAQAMREAADQKGIVPTLVLSGRAPGVDTLGEGWADAQGIPWEPHPARWDDLEAPGAVVRRGQSGKLYNARAGHDRNEVMARRADAAVLVWDGLSTGTQDMRARMRRLGKPVHVLVAPPVRPPPPAAKAAEAPEAPRQRDLFGGTA